jgi:hypothetical protein
VSKGFIGQLPRMLYLINGAYRIISIRQETLNDYDWQGWTEFLDDWLAEYQVFWDAVK